MDATAFCPNIVRREPEHLDILHHITLIHYTDVAMLLRQDEKEGEHTLAA